MRKGQIKILEKAQKENLSDRQITELSKEEYPLSVLNEMYEYFSHSKRLKRDDEAAFNEFFLVFNLLNRDISGYHLSLLRILLYKLPFVSMRKKKQIMKFALLCWNNDNLIYMYADGIACNLSPWHLLYPIKAYLKHKQMNKEFSGWGMSYMYNQYLKTDFLRDDYIFNKEKSVIYRLLNENKDLYQEDRDQIKDIYDFTSHRFKIADVFDVLQIGFGEDSYIVNSSAYQEYRLENLQESYPLLKEMMKYCTTNMQSLSYKTFYIRKWHDENVKEQLEKALQLISPITTSIKTESVSVRIGNTGFINIHHKDFAYIKGELKDNGIIYSDLSSKREEEFVIAPNGSIFIKTAKDKLIPAPLKLVASYYHNTCCKEIFDVIFTAQKNPFIEDFISDTKDVCLLPGTYNEMIVYRNRSEFIKAKYKSAEGIPINWNKVNLSLAYLIIFASNYVKDKKSRSILFLQRDADLLTGINAYNKKTKLKSFLTNILYKNIVSETLASQWDEYNGFYEDEDLGRTIRDYVGMCMSEKEGVDLRIDNIKLLNKKHDAVALLNYEKKTKAVKIPKNSKFKVLDGILPQEFERIRTKKRLIKETAMQSHCVWQYADAITKDVSAIFSYEDAKGKYSHDSKQNRYTIEIRHRKGKGFYISQIKEKYNNDCKREFFDLVQSFLDIANTKQRAA